ncbi:MAG: hypothetical protein ACLT2S_01310 [Christensenellales bacterium]
MASLAGSISFGGGDSIFKVHRETVPLIGSQREGLFFNPPSLINWEKFFDLYEANLKISLKASLLTNWEIFSDLNEKTFENFSATPLYYLIGNFSGKNKKNFEENF